MTLKIRYYDRDKNRLVYLNHKEYFQLNFEDGESMVNTGVQDSIGQDIWEGDIVKFNHKVVFFKDIKILEEKIGEIIFNKAVASFEIKVLENNINMFYPITDAINRGVVIGNIFETIL